MITAKDKAGQTVYITYVNDCGDNAGGFYCETYSDENRDHKIDDFCVHPGDFQPYFGSDFYDRLEEYIRDHYKDTVLDLNYNFDYTPDYED